MNVYSEISPGLKPPTEKLPDAVPNGSVADETGRCSLPYSEGEATAQTREQLTSCLLQADISAYANPLSAERNALRGWEDSGKCKA